MTVTKLTCPSCGSTHIVKNGVATCRRGATGKQMWLCRGCGKKTTGTLLPEGTPGLNERLTKRLHRRVVEKIDSGAARFVITAAQNATPPNAEFFKSLRTYCKRRRAQLIVIPYRYKNPTSTWSDRAKGDDWWAPELRPYLLDKRVQLHKHLQVLADIKTQPTAVNPLQGNESISGGKSAIIGHPKLELKTIATPQNTLPKILTTTGAVTEKNYIPSAAGKKGEFHHTFGACVIELAKGLFHMRQINACSDGSFIDLTEEYDGDEVRPAGRALALVMGDTHQEFVDKSVVRATFEGPNSIVSVLRPQHLVWHDLHDFYARNHHHRGEVFINYVKHHTGHGNVLTALAGTFGWMDEMTPDDDTINVIVKSNHPDALARWVKETDPRTDPENALFWAETFHVMCSNASWKSNGASTIDPFAYWGAKLLKCYDRTRFLKSGETFMLAEVEMSYHGHRGAGGSRGSIRSYRRIGAKSFIAHGHSPGISEGCYQVGTNSIIPLEYAVDAPDAWLHTDGVLYANGKRSLIHIIQGEWRG